MQKTILDANAILRYILNDIQEQADLVEKALMKESILILPEVVAEVIYVLTKYYNQPRSTSAECLLQFLDDADCNSENLRQTLKTFGKSKFDFIDCLLYEYSKQENYKIFTFDADLLKIIKSANL